MPETPMNDRDFKLLVRSFFQERSKILTCTYAEDAIPHYLKRNELEKVILKELERFTEQEQQELPF